QKLMGEAGKTQATGIQLAKLISQFRVALNAGKLEDARTIYIAASKIDANHPDVVVALTDLRKAQDASTHKDKQFADPMDKARLALDGKKLDEATQAVT